MIKLIITDLDGTLLKRGNQSLDKSTLEIIEKLQQQGIMFAAASGRQYPNMRRLFDYVGEDMYYVCENGSIIFHNEEEYCKKTMPKEISLELIHDILEVDGAEALISGAKTSYLMPKTESFYNRMANIVKNDVTLVEDINKVEEDFIKISMYMAGYERVPADINERFREKYKKDLLPTDSGNGWLDFVPKGSSKGTAVQYLMDHLGIKEDEVMIFGDHENDISMLKLTDNSYIMAHSNDYMKQYAKNECVTVDEVLEEMLAEMVI